MKKTLIILALLMCSTLFAQDFSTLDKYELKSKESYVTAEPKILECANYLFSHPVKENELNRLNATSFIIRWAEGCDYTFSIDTKVTDLIGDNQDLLGLYFAGAAKVMIENKAAQLSDTEVFDKTAQLLADYCKNEANKVKPTKALKKLMK